LLPDPTAAENPARAAENEARAQELKQLSDQTAAVIDQINAHQRLQRDQSDFNRIVDRANERLSDFTHLAKDFAQRWLISESLMNQQLRDAFDHAYDGPQQRKHANSVIERTLQRMRSEAAAMPDPDTTADVAAVTAAMRGGSTRAPEEKPLNYGAMIDGEFKRELAKFGL